MVSIDTTEVRHLAFDLTKAPGKVQRAAMAAVPKTLHAIEADAKIGAPVDTGNLANSISTDVDADHLGGEVGPTAEYGADVEYGTEPHVIVAKHGPFLRFVIGGRVIFARSVNHPGTAPQPYMRPAADRNIPLLERALGDAGQDVL